MIIVIVFTNSEGICLYTVNCAWYAALFYHFLFEQKELINKRLRFCSCSFSLSAIVSRNLSMVSLIYSLTLPVFLNN